MRPTDLGYFGLRGACLSLAALLAACGDTPANTTFGAATETGPLPSTVTDTTGTPTTGTPTTGDTTAVVDTTQGVVSTTGDTSTGSTTTLDESSGTTSSVCGDGEIECDGLIARTCDGAGGFKGEETCTDACVPGVGCKPCAPDSFKCVDAVSQKCSADYEWVDFETCDPVQGISCEAGSGQCVGPCSRKELGESYIGCEYYPVSLPNLHETQPWLFHYAVVVANTTESKADVTVTRGGMQVQKLLVGPGNAKVIALPYVDALTKPTLEENGPSVLVPGGAYHLRSTQPVTVYQYEPLEFVVPGDLYSYTNDASLLLPTHIWTGNYMVASRFHWASDGDHLPGFYAVVAREDATTVTLTPSATGGSVYAGGGVASDGTGVVTLNRGDVLEVLTKSNGQLLNTDLSGTRVAADKPVSVFGGHKCTEIPIGVPACDRLEEAMLPIETLSTKYIITPPLIPTGGDVPKAQMVRIIATADATALTYDPPQAGAPEMIAKAGDWVEIAATVADFEITGDKKILVSQYMQGQDAGGGSGDPAMALAVATEQFRDSYLVHAPLSYQTNYANLVAPADAAITLDGAPVAGFTPIGTTGFGVARVPLPANAYGNHVLAGDKPFGVTVYGYGKYTSYWYPGGLDLKLIPG